MLVGPPGHGVVLVARSVCQELPSRYDTLWTNEQCVDTVVPLRTAGRSSQARCTFERAATSYIFAGRVRVVGPSGAESPAAWYSEPTLLSSATRPSYRSSRVFVHGLDPTWSKCTWPYGPMVQQSKAALPLRCVPISCLSCGTCAYSCACACYSLRHYLHTPLCHRIVGLPQPKFFGARSFLARKFWRQTRRPRAIQAGAAAAAGAVAAGSVAAANWLSGAAGERRSMPAAAGFKAIRHAI